MQKSKPKNYQSQKFIKIHESSFSKPSAIKSPRYYEESPEERSQKRGWNEGLKHLVSKNFRDMDIMTKPAFGLPPINFTGKDDNEPDSVRGFDMGNRSEKLWGTISKSLLEPLSDGETMPYVIKVHEARQKLQKRIFL